MDYTIRELWKQEYYLLKDFLYEAIFQPDITNKAPKSIIFRPELYRYVEDFGGRPGDSCFCAVAGEQVVGAVWARIMEGYGSVDGQTPELAVSLYPAYRGRGMGTAFLKIMLRHLKQAGYASTSLAVQKANRAFRLYQRLGFQIIAEEESEYIMVCPLQA